MIFYFCGLSGAGKTTLAKNVKLKLAGIGINTEIIDGDEYRAVISKDLGFSTADRRENLHRLAFMAHKFAQHDIVTLVSAINPFEETREELKAIYPNAKLIYVDCPVNELTKRDTKGLYRKAMLPDTHPDKLHNLTGVNDRFDAPRNPDLYLNTAYDSLADCTDHLFTFIMQSLRSNNALVSVSAYR